MMADETQNPAHVTNGKLLSPKVIDKVTPGIEKGTLSTVNAIVIHQTGGATAQSALASYTAGANGAHFLGTIYQTARIDRKCWHVGEIRSRCNANNTCDADDLKKIKAILFKKGESYAVRTKKLHQYEQAKKYPDRYPVNEDSIGGRFRQQNKGLHKHHRCTKPSTALARELAHFKP